MLLWHNRDYRKERKSSTNPSLTRLLSLVNWVNFLSLCLEQTCSQQWGFYKMWCHVMEKRWYLKVMNITVDGWRDKEVQGIDRWTVWKRTLQRNYQIIKSQMIDQNASKRHTTQTTNNFETNQWITKYAMFVPNPLNSGWRVDFMSTALSARTLRKTL